MFSIIEKYRKEAHDNFNSRLTESPTWREAILESIFRPTMKLPEGKGPMTHLHPDIDKLHLPENCYIADWRKYRVEDHPALVAFQKRCHAAGLHDPWLRNHAFNLYPYYVPSRSRLRVITTELPAGFAIAVAIYLGCRLYGYFYPIEHEHSEEYKAKHKDGHGHH